MKALGGKTSITFFNLFCSNVSKPDACVCSPLIALAIVYQLMICFVFILLSFTTAFHFISSFSTPLPVHLRLLKYFYAHSFSLGKTETKSSQELAVFASKLPAGEIDIVVKKIVHLASRLRQTANARFNLANFQNEK